MKLSTMEFEVEIDETDDRVLYIKVRRLDGDNVVLVEYANDIMNIDVGEEAAGIEVVFT